MTPQGPRSRVLLGTFASVFAVVVLAAGAFSATLALTPEDVSAITPQVAAAKIGPGYGRRPPVNLGKPEKIIVSTPYRPHVTKSRVSRHKQSRPVAAARPATAGPPMKIAEAAPSAYGRSDIQRFH
jgi:hypothetical protein